MGDGCQVMGIRAKRTGYAVPCTTPSVLSPMTHHPSPVTLLLLDPPVLGVPGGVLPGVDGVAVHAVGINAPLTELEDGEGRDVLPVRLGDLAEVLSPLFHVRGAI